MWTPEECAPRRREHGTCLPRIPQRCFAVRLCEHASTGLGLGHWGRDGSGHRSSDMGLCPELERLRGRTIAGLCGGTGLELVQGEDGLSSRFLRASCQWDLNGHTDLVSDRAHGNPWKARIERRLAKRTEASRALLFARDSP